MFEEEITAYKQEIEKLAEEISSTDSDTASDEFPPETRSQTLMRLRPINSKMTSSMGSSYEEDDLLVPSINRVGASSPEIRAKHLLAGGSHQTPGVRVGKQFSAASQPEQGQTLSTRFNDRKQALSLQSPPAPLQASVSLLPTQSGRAVSLPIKCPPQSEIFPSSETAPLQSQDVTSQSQNVSSWSPLSARQRKKKHHSQLRKSISLQPAEFVPFANEEGKVASGKHSSRHSRRSKKKRRAKGEDIEEEDEYADEEDDVDDAIGGANSTKRRRKGKKDNYKDPDRQTKKYKRKLKASLINNTKIKFELLNKERKLNLAELEIKDLKERLKKMDEITDLQKKLGKIKPEDDQKSEVTSCELSSYRNLIFYA